MKKKTLIEQGLDYCKHVEAFETSKILTEPILVNMAGMAAEYLLGGLSQQFNVIADHGDIISHLTHLKRVIEVPENIEKATHSIAQCTSVCSVNEVRKINMKELVINIKSLKEWVAVIIKEV
nr:hypothetical protein [uncultured Carboxylicivirga sp.]